MPLSESAVIVDVEEHEIKEKQLSKQKVVEAQECNVIPLIRRVETIKEAEHVMVEMFLAKKGSAV